jgi:hypothetical protein
MISLGEVIDRYRFDLVHSPEVAADDSPHRQLSLLRYVRVFSFFIE